MVDEGDRKVTDVGSLKVGGYAILEGKACVVKSIQTSKPGKHGHAKCRLEAVSIVDGQKIIQVSPAHDKIDVPIIEKKTAQILSITGKKASVMDMESYETFEMDVPDEMKEQVSDGAQVVYWKVMTQRIMKQLK